jgi:signal recognition particle receptor subunit alpha
MLDFFSIFSKGGILLWCFKGAGLLQKEWEAFTPTVNELIKSVLLQERAVKKSYWEHGQLALKYKMDNEFELVFVIAYQKMFTLMYLDKLLDEIQLR